VFAAYENPLFSKGKEWAKENVRADYSLLSSLSLLGFSAIKNRHLSPGCLPLLFS